MGAFRTYFNGLYNTYLKEPVMAVQNRVWELKGVVESKLGELKGGIEALSSQVASMSERVVTGLAANIKAPVESLQKSLNTVLGPLKSIMDILAGFIPMYKALATMRALKEAHTKEELKSIWDVADVLVKQNVVAVKVYEAVSKELAAQGKETPANLAAGFIGEQIAAAIWKVEEVALPKITGWMDTFAEKYNMTKTELDAMKSLSRSGEFGLNAVVNFMLGVTLYPAVMSSGEPAWLKVRQEAYKVLPVTLLDPRTLVSLKYKKYIPDGLYNDQFGKLGFDSQNIAMLEKDFLYYPAPQDFLRFAVRETFRPEVVKEYGYDTDFPSNIVPYAAKTGMSEEWLKHYWRAHWEIPSPRQGYEMLHRGVIDVKGLETLLKIGDYAPGWVQPLIDISYSPITRVDLRRLYRDEVLTEEAVYRGYLDLGYSELNAKRITAWVVKTSQEEDRELTKAEILKSFRIGETSKDQAIKYLDIIGYGEEKAKYVISYEEYKLTQAERKEEIETVIAELIEGRYSLEEVKAKLSSMDVSIKQANKLIQKAERVIRKRFTLPSKDDCMRWFNGGIINEKVFVEKMIALRYTEDDIKRYLEEVLAGK